MKSKDNFITVILLCMLLAVYSCTDMLELTPDSLITNESFWNTEDDANGALTSMYVDIRNYAAENLFILGEARSEVMEWGGVSGTVDLDKYYNNTLNSTTSGMPSWLGLYEVVNTANLIIKYVPDISIPIEASRNNILAQAYTMRAFIYFVMARTWGGVPLRTSPTEGYSAEITQKERATETEVFTLIKNDLELAISLFEDNAFPAGRNRWSKATAYALKADVFLWTGKRLNGGNADFNTAVEACNEVQKADVSLLSNFADLFEYTKKGNKEVIMAVGFKELEPGCANNYFCRSYSGEFPSSLDPVNGEVIGMAGGSMVWNITELVRNQFTVDDTRRDASFAEVPLWPSLTRKGRGVVISGVRYFTSDIVLYRYADVLLMKAEAKNALGQDPSAEINLVRQRAYGDAYSSHVFVNGSKAQNDAEILKERLLELVVEGKRWWDLVRFEKAFDIVPSLADRQGQDYLLLWPISLNTLSLEPQVQQNPGW